jgi:hypothetical protein
MVFVYTKGFKKLPQLVAQFQGSNAQSPNFEFVPQLVSLN